MNSAPIVDGLNEKQQQSVTLSEDVNALILAGAGSGKTRVLTQRIHYLVTTKNHRVDDILAVTFTNKAANEMKERLSDLLRQPIGRMWVGTFHSLAHRLLRTHPIEANLSPTFQILDAQDQFRIVKRLMKENGIDEIKFPIKKVQWFINQQKDEGILPHQIDAGYNFFVKQSTKVFDLYEKHCQANDLVDFAGLLVKSYELLKNNQSLLDQYQTKFRHILVDEFQDTNRVQYQFIKILHNQSNHVFCVGDDDQSIYGWRGARIENIQKIESDFKPIQVIKLEQNYRSTGNILSASNALIANNQNRLEKSYCCIASNARDFARFGKLYSNLGTWKSVSIIDSSFVATSTQQRFKESPEYGYGFWLSDHLNKKISVMRGILGQYVISIPEDNLIIVRLGHQRGNYSGKPFTTEFYDYINEVYIMTEMGS